MHLRTIFLFLLIALGMQVHAEEPDRVVQPRRQRSPHELRTPILNDMYQKVKGFSRIDTNYIEPQHYNFTVMIQNTNTYELYHLRDDRGQEVLFSPEPAYKVGPYFGWRWIFLGYTVDVAHLKDGDGRQDFSLSLYSNQIGADLFYKKSGNSYRIKKVYDKDRQRVPGMEDLPFDDFSSSIKGFNLYYIFNHNRFSYPAAYSQSTIQRRSCGSAIAGIGYTRHKLNVDWQELYDMLYTYADDSYDVSTIDTTMQATNVTYSDYSLSGGYAYNWVFAYNWLFDISLQAAVGYKHTAGESRTDKHGLLKDFDFKNLNVDGILRAGIVWNNTRWYAGANAIFHTYNYRKSNFSTNNVFGSVNFYAGYNFGKR